MTRLSEALAEANASPEFGEAAWLTFYLCGSESGLNSLAVDLATLNAQNLDGAEGGFLYAKVPVELNAANIERIARQTSAFAERHEVTVDHIDLDSSADTTSKFMCLTGAHR